ncbi:MAG: hypothetical protein N2Z74_06540, partial [Syntrophales bacterium]|nr:hypothetical protein [Syntrophales bacterium]
SMPFASPDFLFLFLPLSLIVCGTVRRWSAGVTPWVVFCFSLVFYAWWQVADLAILAVSMVGNYLFLRLLTAGGPTGLWRGSPRLILVMAVMANLALLAYFKYAGFILSLLDEATATEPRSSLPLGISFFTFTQIAFLIDAARRASPPCPFVHYGLFVAYFPHLIAGPIYHHTEMIGQFSGPGLGKASAAEKAAGLTVLTMGLVKKIILADTLAVYADPVFAAAARGQTPALLESWGAALAYSLQLYFDFSGYMDMAAGVSLLLGVRLPVNFHSPYRAPNIAAFWRRWHMTLGRFFRDYVYIPLGGSRRGLMRHVVNILVTMLLCGLWHGAGWTFVVWGGIHGLYLVLHLLWRTWRNSVPSSSPPAGPRWFRRGLGILVTFGFVTVAWVVFRAETLAAAWLIIKGMAGLHGVQLPAAWLPVLGGWGEGLREVGVVFRAKFDGLWGGMPQLFWIVTGLAICWWGPNTQEIMARLPVFLYEKGRYRPADQKCWWQWQPSSGGAFVTALAALAAVVVMVVRRDAPAFLYFQF